MINKALIACFGITMVCLTSVKAWAQPSAALQAKAVDAASILSTAAAQGRARVIVQYQPPSSGPRAAIGTPQESITAITAENEAIQDSIIAAHFGSPAALSGAPDRGLTRMSISPAFAINASAGEIEALANDNRVVTIELDQTGRPQLIQSVPLVGMNAAYPNGATGAGWAVAVLDTGVEKAHTFITGIKVTAEACFSTTTGTMGAGGSTSLCPGGVSSSTASGSADNCNIVWNGCEHGTHVAGIAVGSNTQLQPSQPSNGVAKSANLIPIKMYSQRTGSDCSPNPFPCATFWYSDFQRALDYVFSIRNSLPGGVQIASINLSGGGGLYSGNCDSALPALKGAIDRLRSAGIPTIVSAGNNSSRTQISGPACVSSAIAVGASSKTDLIAFYSNMSPQIALLAPGGDVNVDSTILASVPAGYACGNYTGPIPSVGGSYCHLQGTSMAAPHVAGAWAAIKSALPTSTVDQVLGFLISTGKPISDNRSGGTITKNRIQVDAALQALKNMTPLQLAGLVPGAAVQVRYIWFRDSGAVGGGFWLTDTGSIESVSDQYVVLNSGGRKHVIDWTDITYIELARECPNGC